LKYRKRYLRQIAHYISSRLQRGTEGEKAKIFLFFSMSGRSVTLLISLNLRFELLGPLSIKA